MVSKRLSFEERFDTVLRRHLRLASPSMTVGDDDELAASGLDSLGTVSLLVDLEETFAVSFPGALLTPATFRTPAALRAAVRSLARP
jgi:acyl carrier protein